jgi:hypothetical protein
MTGSGKIMRSRVMTSFLIAQRVTGGDVLEPDRGGDVARKHFLDLVAVVGMHLQDAADALLLALDRVVDLIARVERTGVHAEERQRSDERVGHDLERERRERLGRPPCGRLPLVLVDTLDRRTVGRRRQQLDDASSIACTPLFLNAVPQNAGMISHFRVRSRIPKTISASDSSPPSRYLFISSSEASAAASTMNARADSA